MIVCPGGETGRRKGLKIPREQSRAGSTPALGTIHHLDILPPLNNIKTTLEVP